MKGVLVCKTCLITNVKMFHLDILANAYSELTGLQCNATTEYVCYECAALLLKYQQFRTKCLQANQVISEFVRKYCKLTENDVSMIDRKLHNLESTIMKFEIKENIFNEIYNESKFNENDNKGPVQSIKMEIDDVIKDETSENKDEVELYDEDQDVSDGNESLHESLNEDDTSVDEDTIIFMVTNETDDENTKNEKMIRPPTNKLDQESVEEGKNNSSTGTLTKRDYSLMEEYVTIVNLNPEEAKKEVLLRQESDNYKKNPYKCDLCYKGYGTLQTYENHLKRHNKDIGDHVCDYCHVTFSLKANLSGHIGKSHSYKFYCKVCPYICASPSQATIHVQMHKGKKYPCEECGLIFSMPNSLSTHQRYKHTSEFVCALCGTVFGKERGIMHHLSRAHKEDTNDQKGPLCEVCDVHFATEAAWKRHLVLSSKHTVSDGCKVCGETFESKSALRDHAIVHARPRWRRNKHCTLCKKTFVGMQYAEHMKKHHPEVTVKRKYKKRPLKCVCEVCGKMCSAPSLLVIHQRAHTNERPYSCAECGKGFKGLEVLANHLKSHASVRAYKCHLCEKTFVYSNSLDKHIKTHLGIRPHKCSICDKSFLTRCEVKYHTQYVHEKVPWPKRDRSKRKKSARDLSPETS